MATQILAIGDTDASSGDVVIDAGEQLTVCLKDGDAPYIAAAARVLILLKDDGGAYFHVGELNGAMQRAVVLQGAGTYRFDRIAGGSCGVFSG